jgi:hypothetical protein
MTHRKSVVLPIAFRSRASKGIYAQSALNLSVYGENYDDIVGVVNLKIYLLILKIKTSIWPI